MTIKGKTVRVVLLAIMLIIHTLFENFFGIAYGVYLIGIYLIALLLGKKIKPYEYLLLSLFVPQKYYQLLSAVIFLIFRGTIKKIIMTRREILFIVFISMVGVANCLFYGGFLPSTVFQIGVYCCIFGLVHEIGNGVDFNKTFAIFDMMLVVQAVAVIIQFIKTRTLGDPLTGTMISAHYLGIYLLMYMYLLWKVKIDDKNHGRLKNALRILVCFLILIFCDAKHCIFIFLFAAFIYWLLGKMKIKNKLQLCGLLLLITMIFVPLVLNSSIGRSALEGTVPGIYIYNEQYNRKYTYWVNTVNQMKSINGLVGFGVGQYGSQIALTMAKGLIHYWIPSEAPFRYASEAFSAGFNGVMDEWYSVTGIPISSFVLGYPFVTLISMIAELGALGYMWFLRILDKKYKGCNTVFIFTFILLGLFDTYLEIPCVFVPLLIGTELLRNKGKISIQTQ